MPQLFTLFGLRFMFYSNDHEPIHVHVVKGGAEARFQVQPEVLLWRRTRRLLLHVGMSISRTRSKR